MRRIVALMLVCILCFGMAGCQKHGYPWKLTKSVLEVPELDATLEIVEGSLTNRGMRVRLCNESAPLIETGTEFYLQVCIKDVWYDMATSGEPRDWPAMSYPAEAGQCIELPLGENWLDMYGELPAGKYRLVKECFVNGKYAREIPICVEFEIP